MALAIHAMIKGNDALTMRFLGRRASRHEEAAMLLKELVRRGHVPPEHARWREAFARAIREKSEYDYDGAPASRPDVQRRIREADGFLAAVRRLLLGRE